MQVLTLLQHTVTHLTCSLTLTESSFFLRSATVDSNLFSTYFGNCPVITAEGRTHPVTAYFLEDIYESINYCLPSDSPAAIRNEISTEERVS